MNKENLQNLIDITDKCIIDLRSEMSNINQEIDQLEMEREDNEGTTQSNFKTAIYETIISQAMGSSIDLTQICNDIKIDFPNIIGVRVKTASINSRTMINYIIAQHFNEKILVTEDDISILA